MQNRSELAIRFHKMPLEAGFPMHVDSTYFQRDLPIRFLHFHGCLELGICHEGNGIFVVGDKVLPFRRGDVSFIEGTEVHLARSAPGTVSRWTWIYLDPVLLVASPEALPDLDPTPLSGSQFCNIISGAKHPDLSRLVSRIATEFCEKPPQFERLVRLLVWQFMLEMKRLQAPTSRAISHPPRHYERLAPALSRLATGHTQTPTVSELAQMCNLSEAHFRRLFTATMGRSPRDYALDVKMRLAVSLLSGTTKPVLTISQETGFDSLSSFNRGFQKTFGMSPREWRQHQLAVANETPALK